MNKVILFYISIVMFLLTLLSNSIATNPDNQYWRSFIYDKQAWELGPVNNIITEQGKFFVSGYFGYRRYDTLCFNGLAELHDSLWVPLGTGANAGVRGIFPLINKMLLKDSILYVAGLFDSAGTVKATNIAKWNVNSREWINSGFGTNGIITSIASINNKIFVCGNFDSLFTNTDTLVSKNIASWNGSNWDSLSTGLNGTAGDMIASDGKLYVIGKFDTAGNTYSKNYAVWNDSTQTWSGIGNQGPIGEIISICKVGSDIYFGGLFDKVKTNNDTIDCKNIAKWNGSNWDSLKSGINSYVFQMKTNGSDLFVVGDFIKTKDDTLICNNIAKWDGSDWDIFGTGVDGMIRTIVLSGDSIFVGGGFNFSGDTLAEDIGFWYKEPPPPPPKESFKELINYIDINAFPNPTKNEMIIEFFVPQKGMAEINLFDIRGNKCGNLVKGEFNYGWHKILWNSLKYTNGIYICEMKMGEKTVSINLIVNR